MDDLVKWLREQIAEDERVAKAASAGGSWRYADGDSIGAWTLYDEHWTIASLKTYRHDEYDYSERMPAVRHPRYVDADANGEHIARHDPAAVLAQCEAHRRVLERHTPIPDHGRFSEDYADACPYEDCGHAEQPPVCRTCRDVPGNHVGSPCDDLLALALAYRHRPGYQETWRP